jgi:pyruvate dehydrogenase E1 component beta subunit
MIKLTYREALKQGIRDALKADETVFLMGEDVGRYGGAFAVSKGLLKEFGEERIMDVPLSESGFVGAGIGAALNGMKPIVEVMTINFSLLAMDQIVNNAATLRHMSGGQFSVPLVIRMGCGIGRQLAAQHSHSWEPFYAAIPGLKVLSVGTHEDARGMLMGALKENGPVIIFEYTYMLNMEAEIEEEKVITDISKAKVRKPGKDISIITYGACVYKCLEAANELAFLGIDAEVVDLRSLRPIDKEKLLTL